MGTRHSGEKQPGARPQPPHFSPRKGRGLRDGSCHTCRSECHTPMLRGKVWRAVHRTERALFTLASPPPFTNSSSVIPSAMHSTMSKKRESWGKKGLVGCNRAGWCSHPDPPPCCWVLPSCHRFHPKQAVQGQTGPTEMPDTREVRGPVPHKGTVTWMGGAPESSPM